MPRIPRLTIPLIILLCTLPACSSGSDPTVPIGVNPDIRIAVSRVNPSHSAVDMVKISVTRLENGHTAMPGRNIVISVSDGSTGMVTDRGDGIYESIWTGATGGEIIVIATDVDSTPTVEVGITFLALEYLVSEWDVPVKLSNPVSTGGWESAPFLFPDGDRIAFAYITLDMVALAAGVTRLIGQERPGQSTPQTFDIYFAERPDDADWPSWWAGWTVEHAQVNLFQSLPMHLAAPSVTSDGLQAFCTIQEFNGLTYDPTTIYITDPQFSQAPNPIGAPVDMTGLGEDNPYFDVTNGWLYFDTYDLGNPLSKQNIWAAESLGGSQFNDPIPLVDLNTINIETQPFMHEPTGMLYFATDRGREEFVLAIWRSQVFGSFTNQPEEVAVGEIAIGHPSISSDGEWFCFVYARLDIQGANADIAMSRRIE